MGVPVPEICTAKGCKIGVPAGLLLSTVIFAQISKLPEEALLTWGWRVAFLLSFVLVGVGLFIRLAVVEPPMFAEMKKAGAGARMPILDAVRAYATLGEICGELRSAWGEYRAPTVV